MSDQEPIITTLYVIVDNFCQSELEMAQETSQREKWSVIPAYDWYDEPLFSLSGPILCRADCV